MVKPTLPSHHDATAYFLINWPREKPATKYHGSGFAGPRLKNYVPTGSDSSLRASREALADPVLWPFFFHPLSEIGIFVF